MDGRRTQWGAVVRSASLDHLTPLGWSALHSHGIQTIVDLRNTEERTLSMAGATVVQVPLEEGLDDDPEYSTWKATGRLATPLYYSGFLERWPDRCAAAVAAVARAESGGVVVHCGRGRDRTGLIVMLLLALVGVPPEDIAADYAIGAAATFDQSVRDTVASLDLESVITGVDLTALRRRLL
jgi:protein tyrosine/serine phosphatase